MPKIMEKMKNSIHYILFFFPAVLGFYGYMQLGAGTALDCAYKTLQLYVVEFALEGEMTNWAVEIARWTAPLATAAALLSALCSMWESFKVYVKAQWGAIAVHGDNPNTDYVVKTLGSRGIYSDKDVAFKAKKHILMFNEDMDMYHFLQSHGDVLDDDSKDIYICSETARQGKFPLKPLLSGPVCNWAKSHSLWD